VVKWLTLLVCIQEAPGSNLGSETSYPDLNIFMVFLSPPDEYLDITLKLSHDYFLPNPFQFIIHLLLYFGGSFRIT
jgi:hypothetical protein